MRVMAAVGVLAVAASAQPLAKDELAALQRQVDGQNQAARDAALEREGLTRLTLSGTVTPVSRDATEWTWREADRTLVSPTSGDCQPKPGFVRHGEDLWALSEEVELPLTSQQVEARCEGPATPVAAPPPRQRCRVVVRFSVPAGLVFRGVRVVKAPFTQVVPTCGPVSTTVPTPPKASPPPPGEPPARTAAPKEVSPPPARRFCDRAFLACKQPEPACPAGSTSIDGNCFGTCVPVTACACDTTHHCPTGASCSAGQCH